MFGEIVTESLFCSILKEDIVVCLKLIIRKYFMDTKVDEYGTSEKEIMLMLHID